LGRPRAVLPFADVVNLLADELARLRAGRLPLALVLPGTLDRLFLRHGESPCGSMMLAPPRPVNGKSSPRTFSGFSRGSLPSPLDRTPAGSACERCPRCRPLDAE